MKNNYFTILFLIVTMSIFGQNMIKEMGNNTCDCIQKNDENITFDEKFKKCAAREAVAYSKLHKEEITKNNKDYYTVENIRKRHLAIKTYIEENCEANIKTEKLSKEDLKSLSKETCECISKISYKVEAKNDSIKSCIDSQLTLFQFLKLSTQVEIDSTSTKVKPKKVNLNLLMGTNNNLYKELEDELLTNCKELKGLMMSNNTNKHFNSVSFNERARKFYDEADYYLAKRDFLKAIPLYEKSVKIDENFAFAWDNLGICYRHTKQYKKAIKAYKKSMEIDPKGKTPIMNLGVVYGITKEFNKAIKIYKKYVDLLPEDPEGYFGLGRMYFFKKNYDLALKNSLEALRIYTENSSPYRADAINMVKYIYKNMKAENKLDEFNKLAKKYKLEIN